MTAKELLDIHRWIQRIQQRDDIPYDQACERLYAEQFERLKCADEDSKAWNNLLSSVKVSLTGAQEHAREDPQA